MSSDFAVDGESMVGRVLEALKSAPRHVLDDGLSAPVIQKGIEVPAVYVDFDALV